MANHGKSRHLKRLASPTSWGIGKKKIVWAKKPLPGAHALKDSVPLTILLRDVLKIVNYATNAKHLVSNGSVLVDGRRLSEDGFGVGLMDVVSIPKTSQSYVIIPKGRKLVPKEVTQTQANTKYCRLNNKIRINKSKIQLNLHDGRNLLIEREEDTFKTGDTLVITIPKQELQSVLKFSKGAHCLITKGKHAGETGELVGVNESNNNATIRSKDNKEITTLKKYLFVIDEKLGV